MLSAAVAALEMPDGASDSLAEPLAAGPSPGCCQGRENQESPPRRLPQR